MHSTAFTVVTTIVSCPTTTTTAATATTTVASSLSGHHCFHCQSINSCRVSFIRPVALFLSLLSDPSRFMEITVAAEEMCRGGKKRRGAGINESTQKKSGISSGCNVGGSCRETMADS
mmetsp:Transcript_37791/g.91934  ORF Transcript_37791/g.91934 Transcript_37791/m.91934 type:complete len:118 (+) Transcript_37791:1410-1763(+)